MRQFSYWRDPFFLAGCALYALNRWLIKPCVQSPFLQGQFNDCLLIPCALPLVLWVQRRLNLRQHDAFPSIIEITFNLVVWSVIAEVIGPRVARVTGDMWDIVAYCAGGLLAWSWWRWRASVVPKLHEF